MGRMLSKLVELEQESMEGCEKGGRMKDEG